MTSSFIRWELDRQNGGWSYSLPGSPLGGMEDSYLKLNGNCSPDFVATPIGHRYGAKMCTRKPDPGSMKDCGVPLRIGDRLHNLGQQKIEQSQGYNRASVNLYDPQANFPTTPWNPDYYSSRRIPWEGQLLRADYLREAINYNGTGIGTIRTPTELRDKGTHYMEYGYSFTPDEGLNTGKRVATSFAQNVPPVKWDVTRLEQPYITFKTETAVMGHNHDYMDTQYYKRIV